MSTMNKKSQKVKFKKAPGAPKRFKSAYMFFSEQQHKKFRAKASDKKIRAADVAKLVSQAWKELSDVDRQVWVDMGRRDRERYEREKASYKGPWKIPDIKHPNAPKKPMSAFLAFGNERRGVIAEANPSLTGTEISALLSKLWKDCPNEIKKVYREQEARERKEFKRKLAEWERRKDAELVSEYTGSPQTSDDEMSADTPSCSEGDQVSLDEDRFIIESTERILGELVASSPKFDRRTFSMAAEVEQEGFFPNEVWPFNHMPEPLPLPNVNASAPDTVRRFDNYSLDDALQDEELFFEDFSPSQVLVPYGAYFTHQSAV